jgi:fibronectin type 3 domain-containing protein
MNSISIVVGIMDPKVFFQKTKVLQDKCRNLTNRQNLREVVMLHKLLTSFAIAFLFVLFLTTAGLKEVQGGDVTITGLFAVALTNKPTVMMYWYEPENFKPVRFEIGYSVLPITEDNWNEITKTGNAGGSAFWGYYGIVDNLNLDTTYYLAIKGYDSAGNSTAISNVVNVKTTDSVKNWNPTNFIGMENNSWWNLNPTLRPGSTSQVFLAYDKIKDMLMTWGGHPWGGSYPQIDEIYTYNIGNLANVNTWWLEDINLANTSDIPNGGCSTSGNWDDANKLMVKFVQSPRQDYEYWRGENFEVYPWIYDFIEHKWYDMKSFGLRDVVGYASNAPGHTYNSDDQYHIFVPAEMNALYKTMFYDAYTNKTFRMKNFDATQLVSTRNDMGLVYDSKRKRFVVVGGSLQRAPAYNDVWEFSFAQMKWIKVEGVINSEIIPTYKADSSAAIYDSLHDKIILFNMMGRDYELNNSRIILTFIYDPETKTWSRGNDMPGFASSHRLMELNAVFSEQHNAALVLDSGNTGYEMMFGNTSNSWAYRYSSIIPPQTKPNPPQNASSETTSNSVILKWQPSDSSGITGYNIYRAQANNPWETSYSKITTLPSSAASYTDTTAIPGKIYFYYITAVNSSDAESDSSLKVRSQPRVIKDGYVTVLSDQQTKVHWTPRIEDNDVIGYNIYRAETSYEVYPVNQPLNYGLEIAQYTRPTIKNAYETEGSYVKINSSIVTTNDYIDNINLQNSDPDATYPYKVYAYRVKAVNKFGVEGGWSPYWLTIPNPTTGIKVTKDNINHYVSWVAPHNGEGIIGYRVYVVYLALWGREELTSEILSDTNIVVPTTRYQIYYVTAIDTLNQEGIPSSGSRSFSNQYYEFGITTSFLPDGILGQGYNIGLQVVNGTGPFRWQIVSGSLPGGLTLGNDGKISGTPGQAAAYTFMVKVTDSSSPAQEATKEFSLRVEAIAMPPVAEANGLYEGQVGTPLTLNAGGSYDTDGAIVLYEWDVNGDGTWDIRTDKAIVAHTWPVPYGGNIRLRVTDNDGLTGIDTASVAVIAPPPPKVKGDLDGDGDIDLSDYQAFRSTLGKCKGQQGYNPDADYDGDRCVTFADYRIWYGYYKSQK